MHIKHKNTMLACQQFNTWKNSQPASPSVIYVQVTGPHLSILQKHAQIWAQESR